MKSLFSLWTEEDGVLAFEWTLLFTLVTIGVVSGITAMRDGVIDELGDVAQSMLAVDQSYTVSFPQNADVHLADGSSASDTAFTDAATYTDCERAILLDPDQPFFPIALDDDGNGP